MSGGVADYLYYEIGVDDWVYGDSNGTMQNLSTTLKPPNFIVDSGTTLNLLPVGTSSHTFPRSPWEADKRE